MPSIPLAVVWLAILCGYLPYTMGYAFLNPIVLIGYGALGLLIGANIPTPKPAIAASLLTTTLAIAVVNLTSGIPHLVLPSPGILLATATLSLTTVLAATGLRHFWRRRNLDEDQIRLRLRLAFAALALAVYLNGYLPYNAKMWIAARTTNPDLIQFALLASAACTALWFIAKSVQSEKNPEQPNEQHTTS